MNESEFMKLQRENKIMREDLKRAGCCCTCGNRECAHYGQDWGAEDCSGWTWRDIPERMPAAEHPEDVYIFGCSYVLSESDLENRREKIAEQIKEGVVLLNAGMSFLGINAQAKWNDMQTDKPIIGQACAVIINEPMRKGTLATYEGGGEDQ